MVNWATILYAQKNWDALIVSIPGRLSIKYGFRIMSRAVLVDPVLTSPFINMQMLFFVDISIYIYTCTCTCVHGVCLFASMHLSILSIYLSFYLYLFFCFLFFYPSICLHGQYNIYIDYMYIYTWLNVLRVFALSCQVATHTYIYTYILIVYKSMSSLVNRLSLVAQDQLWHRKLIFYRRPQG